MAGGARLIGTRKNHGAVAHHEAMMIIGRIFGPAGEGQRTQEEGLWYDFMTRLDS